MASKTLPKIELPKIELPKIDVRAEATRAFYAYAGVNDLAVELVKDALGGATKRVAGVQNDLESRVADVRKSVRSVKEADLAPQAVAGHVTGFVNGRVEALTKDARARREAIEAKVAELQSELKAYPTRARSFVDENVEVVTGRYDDLVKRGESLVGRLRAQETTVVSRAKEARTQLTKVAETRVGEVREDVKETVDRVTGEVTEVVRKATGRVARTTPQAVATPAAPEVEPVAKVVEVPAQETLVEVPAATETVAKKPTATKAAPAKPTTKAPAKPATEEAPGDKLPAKKPAAKKAPSAKAATAGPAKAAAKKAPAKKAPARKAPAKKAPATKAAAATEQKVAD